jgi:membrane fusion protein (multidrug efflux system)
MDAQESDHKNPPDPSDGTAHRDEDKLYRVWPNPDKHRSVLSKPLTTHLNSPPPEAFGRGVLENAPEAFGRTESREQEDKKEKSQDKDGEKDKKREDSKEKDKKDDEKKDKKDDEDKEPKKPPFYKRPILMTILALVLIVAIVGGIIYWLYARQFETTDDAFIDGHIIAISPDVAATVASVYIDDNWVVKRGQLLVQLDPRDYQAVVDQMTANVSAARDRSAQASVELDASLAGITDAQAQVTIAQTNAENASLNYHRYAALSLQARSQEQFDNVIAAHRSADAQVLQAKARLVSAQATADSSRSAVITAGAEIKVAEANLHQAQINLAYCRIVAPEDGLITSKDVEPGSYVEKAQPLFSIVQTDTWVVANFKETQLKLIRINQPATVEVDAIGGKIFQGHVDSIQNGTGSRFSLLPAENATGNWVKVVQRVPVKIVLDNASPQDRQELLSPGLSVEASIKVR